MTIKPTYLFDMREVKSLRIIYAGRESISLHCTPRCKMLLAVGNSPFLRHRMYKSPLPTTYSTLVSTVEEICQCCVWIIRLRDDHRHEHIRLLHTHTWWKIVWGDNHRHDEYCCPELPKGLKPSGDRPSRMF